MPHIPASPPPGGGLGTVPGALAPSHELHDEVRTSARDRLAAPSPLRATFPGTPKLPKPLSPPGAEPPGSSPQAQPHTFRGRRGDLAHPAHLRALGPGGRGSLAVPGPERIHFGLWGHHRAELLLRGVKSRSRDRDGDRGRRAGGRHGQAGLLGVGGQVTRRRARADDPQPARLPAAPAPPPLPVRGRRAAPRTSPRAGACAPRLSWPPRSRVRGLCVRVPSSLQPGGEGRREEGGKEGAGRERRSDHTRSCPERGREEAGRADPAGNSPRKGPSSGPGARGSAKVLPPRRPGRAQTSPPQAQASDVIS